MEKLCEAVHISVNKNAICGDRNAVSPGAVRLGTPALTTRGFSEVDFETVASFLDRTLQLGLKLQAAAGKKLDDFILALDCDDVKSLRADVHAFANVFPMPGLGF